MDPSTFETMREEQLQQLESTDVTNAAHILGKTLGVPIDGVPSFMQRPDIPGLPKQQEGIPPDHDCTICAATAACGFFNEAQKNGGNNPLMRRLQAVQELTKSNPDLMKGPDAENLIRERMNLLKTQTTSMQESSPEPINRAGPKPAEVTPQEQVQVIKEKPLIREPNVAEQSPVTAQHRSEITRPDLKSTVTRFEETVHFPKTVIKDVTPEPKPQIAVSADETQIITPQTEPAPQSSESQVQFPQSGNETITQGQTAKKKQPIQIKSTHGEKTTPEEKPLTEQSISIESQSPEKKPTPKSSVEPIGQTKENTRISTLSETPANIKEGSPPKPAATEHQTDQPSIIVPPTNETVLPAQVISEKKPFSNHFSTQSISENIPQPFHEQKKRTSAEQPAVGVVPTPLEPIPAVQPSIVEKPAEPSVPIMTESQSKAEDPSHADTEPQPTQMLESVFSVPDEPVLVQNETSAESKALDTTAPTENIKQPAIGSIHEPVQSILEESYVSETYEDGHIPNLSSPENTETFTEEFPADESHIIELGFDSEAQAVSLFSAGGVEVQQTEISEIPVSETLIEELTDDDLSLEYFTEETVNANENVLSPSVPDVTGFVDIAENIFIAENQTITLFSYDELPKIEPEEAPTHEKMTANDVPYIPLESIDFTQLFQDAEKLHQDESIGETTDLIELISNASEPEEVSPESLTETSLQHETTQESSFPEPFPLILETEQEVIDQIFKGVEEQAIETPPLVVMALPTAEVVRNDIVPNSTAEAELKQASSSEILVFVWNESILEELSELSDTIFEVLEALEIEDEEMTGLFDTVFDSMPDVVDEELKNDTFGKYDDTVVLLWYILKIFSLFGQAMLYINPEAIKQTITNPSHSTVSRPILDQEDHISM